MSDPQLDTTARAVILFFKDEPWKAILWFVTPNPQFGLATPFSMIQSGRQNKVIQFVKAAMYLNEAPE
jgi:hypothetical protein